MIEKKERKTKRKSRTIINLFISLFLFLSFFLFPAYGASGTVPGVSPKPSRSKSLLIHLQYGWPYQYVSDTLYANFNQAGLAVALEKECGLWPFFNNRKLVESLLFELRFSRIRGKTIELSQDQVAQEIWQSAQKEGHRPRTDWDHSQIGLTPYYRLYYPLCKEVRVYAEAGIGFTFLNSPLVEEGTLWNFLITGGLGLDFKLCKIPLYSFARFEHFSNGGKLWKEGFTDKRVIGPETFALGFGIRLPLN